VSEHERLLEARENALHVPTLASRRYRAAQMTTADPRPPGWYPDPFERLRFRWWDGDEWTAYAAAADRAVQWDPGPVETTEPPPPGLPGLITAFVGYGVAVGLSLAIIGVLVALDRPGGRTAAIALSELGLWGGLVGACIVVSHRRGTGSLVRDFDFRFRWSDLGFGLAGAIAGRLLSAAMVAPLPVPSRRLRDIDKSVFHNATHGATAWIVLIVVTCVGAPLVEELFFRGLLQTRLVGRFGVVPGIIGASLLFGAAHMIAWQGIETFAYAWAIAGGGLVLGTIRYLTGRLGPGIIAHSIFNALAVLAIALLSHFG